ncbi:MAG: hypothetical protein ACOYL6_00760 [Bacteriovoracaceae bacterium]
MVCFNSYAVTTLEQCNSLKNNILEKAIIEDLKSLNDSNDDHHYRFVKDEKEALKFISGFDAEKIGLDLNAETFEKELKDCESSKSLPFCENSFPTFNFFRGLLYGAKHYNWSKATKVKAINKTWTYLNEVQKNKPSWLDINMAISILGMMNFDNILDPTMNQKVAVLSQKIESESLKLKKLVKNKKQSKNCSDYKDIREEETKVKNHFALELGLLLKSQSSKNP